MSYSTKKPPSTAALNSAKLQPTNITDPEREQKSAKLYPTTKPNRSQSDDPAPSTTSNKDQYMGNNYIKNQLQPQDHPPLHQPALTASAPHTAAFSAQAPESATASTDDVRLPFQYSSVPALEQDLAFQPTYSRNFSTPLSTTQDTRLNLPFGNLLTSAKSRDNIRLYFQNGNGVRPYSDWARFQHACNFFAERDIDVFGITETNIDWNTSLKMTARSLCQRHFTNALLSTASSSDQGKSDFQPGGTMTAITGRWTGRSAGTIQDLRNMGRWSGFSLHCSNGKLLHIITAYRPVESSPTGDGSITFFQQNWNVLRREGINQPNPPKQSDKVILMLDANELLKGKYLPTLLSQTNLTSLVHSVHEAPATYNRGQKCIDFIFGSQSIHHLVPQSGYTGFYDSGFPLSDHRAIFVDIDSVGLFGATTSTIAKPISRRLTSKNRKGVQKFISALSHTTINNLHESLKSLSTTLSWNETQAATLERIDQQFTAALLAAEAQASVPNIAWSPALHNAFLVFSYWSITITATKTNRDALTILTDIRNTLLEIKKVLRLSAVILGYIHVVLGQII
jgi:hypothetical protein